MEFPGAWTCGAIIPMPHRCNNKGDGLGDSQLFEIPASRNSNEASRHIFQEYTHTHTFACRYFENSPQIRDALQAPFLLERSTFVFPEFTSLHGRGSPHTKPGLTRAAPRLCNLASLHGHVFPNPGRESRIRLGKGAQKALRKPKHSAQAFCSAMGRKVVSEMQNQGEKDELS